MSKKTLISIVIPTRANNLDTLSQVLGCLAQQTLKDFEVILICDRAFDVQERSEFQNFLASAPCKEQLRCFSHHNSDFHPKSKGGASYVRNFGILQAKGEFIQLFDDDNSFDAHYLATAMAHYQQMYQHYGQEVVITPTLLLRDTSRIQNQGFSGYNYRLARPKIHFLAPQQAFGEIQMFSGNWVFAKRTLMQQTLYDEEIAWIAEDLDFVYRLSKQAKILTFADLQVQHREREKTILEQARIGNPASAEQKIKNIFLRHKKHANFFQRVLFVCWSSRGITSWLSLKALRFGWGEKFEITKALWRGYVWGWRSFFIKK